MLYQERVLGRRSLWSRLAASLKPRRAQIHPADLDLLSMNPHLRRDLGLEGDRSAFGTGTLYR